MTVLTLLERVLVPSLIVFLLIGSLASITFGWVLIFRTAQALSFMRGMNRWVSTRRALKELEVPRHAAEPRKAGKLWLGLFLIAGGGFALYALLIRIEIPRAAVVLGVNIQRWFIVGVALQTVKWLLVVGSLLAVAVGILMLFFPRMLAAFEAGMNRWYSTRNLVPTGGESMKFPLAQRRGLDHRRRVTRRRRRDGHPAGCAAGGLSLLARFDLAVGLRKYPGEGYPCHVALLAPHQRTAFKHGALERVIAHEAADPVAAEAA